MYLIALLQSRALFCKSGYALIKKNWLIMRMTIVLLFIACLQVSAKGGYTQSVTLTVKNAPLEKVFKELKKQTGYDFWYENKLLDRARRVDLDVRNIPLEQALDECFKDQPFAYSIVDKIIVVKLKPSTELSAGMPVSIKTISPLLIDIHGVITDDKGQPLSGATILVKGTQVGTKSDANGSYSINAGPGSTLVVSFVGFESVEVKVDNRTNITVQLRPSVSVSDEVVVTALGIERQKKTLTYSTQSVNPETLTKNRDLNVVNALQGKVAGLNIVSGSSGVGSSSRVILRGNRSINGSSQPLYVIDGVPVRGEPEDLNPDNIVSINILKGANASALYGSSGQNGVIVIETRKGKQGFNVGLSTTYMAMEPIQSIPFQYQYGQGAGSVYNKASEDAWGPKFDGSQVSTWSLDPAQAGTTYAYEGQNGVKEGIFQRGYNSATNLSIIAGNEKIKTAFNYTYTNAEGIVPNNALQRHNIALRITNQVSKRFSIDSKIEYIKQNVDNRLDEGESSFNPIRQIYTMPPNIRKQDVLDYEFLNPATGVPGQNYWANGAITSANPYWALYRNLRYDKSDRVIAMTALSYQFTDDLKLTARGSYDGEYTGGEEKSYNGTFRDPAGRYALGSGTAQQTIGDFLLSYHKQISTDWSVSANVGGEIRDSKATSISSSTGAALNIPNLFALTNTSLPTTSNAKSRMQTQSLYANGVVGWKDALFLDVSARNDWNSTLPAANRSYFYPSAGVSAILSQLLRLPETFSYLKLRGSWAQVGNGTSPYLLQRTATSIAGGSLGYILLDATLPNTQLRPEKTTSKEIGLEMSLFDSRIGLDLTLYKTNTNDQLFRQDLPVGSGAASFFTNGGDVENRGIEIVLNTTPVKTKNFTWDLNFNYAANHNVVKKISADIPRLIVGGDTYMRDFVLEEGKPFGLIYGKGFRRNDKGEVLVGANGLPQLSAGKTVLLGNINPQWTGGVSSSFSYKNWNFNFVISHKQGGTVASFTDAILYGSGLVDETLTGREGGLIFGQNIFTDVQAVKAADGTKNDIAITSETLWKALGGRSAPTGEAFARSATNTRLREMSIGYRLSFDRKIFVSSIDISLVGRNLLFLYRKDTNIDPDYVAGTTTISEGFQSFAPPTTRSFGVNLRFNF
jgi:TonB-linked SusC/RagA family outer membrane protein